VWQGSLSDSNQSKFGRNLAGGSIEIGDFGADVNSRGPLNYSVFTRQVQLGQSTISEGITLFFVILKASYLAYRPDRVSLRGGCKATSKTMARGSLSEIFLAGSHHCVIKLACPVMPCYVLLREAECYITVTS